MKPEVRAVVQANGQKACVTVTEKDFENVTRPLMEQVLWELEEFLGIARERGWEDIDQILLIGGMSSMPQVRKSIQEAYPDIPMMASEAKEAVAKGAAIYGKRLGGKFQYEEWNGSSSCMLKLSTAMHTTKTYGIRVRSLKGERIRNFIFMGSRLPQDVNTGAIQPTEEAIDMKKIAVYESESMEQEIELSI